MARELPKLPKQLDLGPATTPAETARRLAEWARSVQAVLEALRARADAPPDVAGQLSDGSAPHADTHLPSGADPLETGTPGSITPGDSAAEGAAESFARSDHKHSIAGFGSSAGTFCQGNDSRLSDARAPTGSAGGDLSGTYPNPTVAKLQGRAVNSTAPTTGNALVWSGIDWAPGASSGVGGIQTWFPDAPPTSAHSADDEMDGGSIDAKWTEIDPSSSVVWDVDTTKHMYRAVQTGNGNVRWSMLHQAVPDSEFAIYTKCDSITEQGASGVGIGLFVSDDLATNPTTADFRTVELVHGSGSPFRFVLSRTWSAYNGTVSAASSNVVMGHYLRIRCNGTAFKADVSSDGVGWYRVSSVTLGFTPTHCGICFLNVDNAVEATGLFTFYRTQSGAGTSGYNSTYIGRYV